MTAARARTILYTVAAVIALAGLADATYLTVQFLTGETAVCGGSPDCFKVLGSVYSHIGRIPVAGAGALAYYAVFSFAIFSAFNYARARKLFVWMVWAMFAATLWFLFVQAFILHAFCRFCLFSAAVVFLLTGLVVASPAPTEDATVLD
jgi:uncharacterized membrane protein